MESSCIVFVENTLFSDKINRKTPSEFSIFPRHTRNFGADTFFPNTFYNYIHVSNLLHVWARELFNWQRELALFSQRWNAGKIHACPSVNKSTSSVVLFQSAALSNLCKPSQLALLPEPASRTRCAEACAVRFSTLKRKERIKEKHKVDLLWFVFNPNRNRKGSLIVL